MNSEHPRSRPALSKELINLQDQYLNSIKDVRRSRNGYLEVKKMDYDHHHQRRSLISQGHGKRIFRYFTLESLLLLVCLTVSLLVLPVVLPPLPPPPFLLLLLPIFILALLMLLAFMPSGVREVAHAYA
ncbi:protein AUXIN-REGULATED GENE INVOLVED IN ORGAN SIZE-like [Salvia miltiorrhiza]|uniref:protein AUXIN-REGULATED GENE INVOLVED IN ORGAN SIZE-like n=1 Tax=Salvia miltiorrhiza TaxID=226208 RepID=UPI0025ABE4B7|nr:protein AUXIN-REGULATED GENE INVOLVED IN ORGAN SIZE-like [Salvia miltiorrhiza]XP_057781222.1 protein AUXIN-REGULATED GENE INVOLVED IN ORGAN SIZE-like [Salvia miltiorrhiza]